MFRGRPSGGPECCLPPGGRNAYDAAQAKGNEQPHLGGTYRLHDEGQQGSGELRRTRFQASMALHRGGAPRRGHGRRPIPGSTRKGPQAAAFPPDQRFIGPYGTGHHARNHLGIPAIHLRRIPICSSVSAALSIGTRQARSQKAMQRHHRCA